MNSQLSSLKYKKLSGRISVPEILAVVSLVPRMRKPSQPISLILPVSGRRGKRYQLSLGQPLIDRWNRCEGRPYEDRCAGLCTARFPWKLGHFVVGIRLEKVSTIGSTGFQWRHC
jgi:hypothetical protein